MPDDLVVFIVIGFLAQLVDGALGMAFGVLTTTCLLAFGVLEGRVPPLWEARAEDFPLEEIGFDAKDLDELMPEPPTQDVDADAQTDKAEELRAKWGVELGQVWQLDGIAAGMAMAELACAAWCVLSLRRLMLPKRGWA